MGHIVSEDVQRRRTYKTGSIENVDPASIACEWS